MKYLVSIVIYCLFAIALISCEQNTMSSFEPIEPTSEQRVQPFGLSDSDIDAIGDTHGWYLQHSYAQLSSTSSSTEAHQLGAYFSNLEVDLSNVSYTPKSLYSMSVQKHYALKQNGFFLSASDYSNPQMLNAYLELIFDDVDRASDFQDFRIRMDRLDQQVKSDKGLTGFEVETVLVTISVAKSSVKLWMPPHMGGEGLSAPSKHLAKWNWGNAVLGDISGAMAVMAELGVAGAVLGSVPGTNAAIGLAVGISSGIGSAIGGLT